MESTAENAELAKQFGFTINKRALAKALKELEELEHEAREIRAKSADWEYIEKQRALARMVARRMTGNNASQSTTHSCIRNFYIPTSLYTYLCLLKCYLLGSGESLRRKL